MHRQALLDTYRPKVDDRSPGSAKFSGDTSIAKRSPFTGDLFAALRLILIFGSERPSSVNLVLFPKFGLQDVLQSRLSDLLQLITHALVGLVDVDYAT